jgi:hypothetical protein
MITLLINKGLHWIGISEESKSQILEMPFAWGEEKYPVGHSFDRLGVKDRTSLCIGEPIEFCGFLRQESLLYALFEVSQNSQGQLQLFEGPVLTWYIAPIVVDSVCLLMPSGASSFYDIRP